MRYDQYDEVTTAPSDAQILLNRPSTTSGTYPNGTPAWITPGNLLTDSDAVLSVNGAGPDGDGNVLLTASDVGALAPDGDGSALTGITHGQVSGLGSAALAATSAFDAAGAAAAEATRAEAAEALKAPLASPVFTGTPTATTQTAGNNSTRLATTAYADGAVATEATRAEAAEALLAPKASPAFTGSPTAPTQTSGDSSTKLATTAFVAGAVPVANVLDPAFAGGADPTGASDSSAAINAMITALNGAGGGTGWIPAGTYKLTSPVQHKSGVRLVGAGPGATILKPTASNNGVNVTAASAAITDCVIEDLQIQGPNSGTGIGIYGVANSGTDNVARLAVRRVLVTLMGGNGIEVHNAILSELSQVYSTGNLGRGFYALTGTTWHISASFFEDNASGWGVYLDSISSSTLASCGSDRNAGGWYLTGCNDVALVSCDSYSTAAAAGVDGTSFKVDSCFGVNLLGAYVDSNAAVGVWFLNGSYGCSLWGVTETATGSPTASIQTDSGTNVYIAGYNLTTDPSYAPGTVALVSGAFSVFGACEIQDLVTDNPVALNGGTDTSGTAAASSPSFTTATAKQLSTTQDVMLYIAVQTSAALAVAIGPASTTTTALMPSKSYALGLIPIRVPKSWWVKITGTIADLTITQVTC